MVWDGELEQLISDTVSLISPYVEKDLTSFVSHEDFLTGTETLKSFCNLRAESVSGQLDGTIPLLWSMPLRSICRIWVPRIPAMVRISAFFPIAPALLPTAAFLSLRPGNRMGNPTVPRPKRRTARRAERRIIPKTLRPKSPMIRIPLRIRPLKIHRMNHPIPDPNVPADKIMPYPTNRHLHRKTLLRFPTG